MQMSSKDASCRYLAAPGTQTKGSSPFGKFLSAQGIELPTGLNLELMVARGWVKPILRVALPRAVFDAWTNYPASAPVKADECPDTDVWALNLYVAAMSGGFPVKRDSWWLHDLDDDTNPVTVAARAHRLDPVASLPASFRHARHNQEIRPWMDYFAYWQAFQIADYAHSMTGTYALTDDVPADPEGLRLARARQVEATHQWLSRRWANRGAVFDWLSRMRTVLGSSVMPQRSYEEREAALKRVAQDQGLTVDRMRTDARATLLRIWRELTDRQRGLQRSQEPLLHLLRQEIGYAIMYIEEIGGERIDYLDDFWSPSDGSDGSARLIDALPREEDLARRFFPWHADGYVRRYRDALPALAGLNEAELRGLIEKNWTRSRPLRRFVLAFRRLHEQLQGEQLTAEEKIIRQTERIEQFNLVVMHAERVLSHEVRERQKGKRYPDVRDLVRECLNHVLGKWGLLKGGFSATAHPIATALLKERPQLHELDENSGLPLVETEEVKSGNPVADQLIAAFVNFVIARNYAAHHDALDFDLVYPTNEPGTAHPGGVALECVLLAVLTTLLTR